MDTTLVVEPLMRCGLLSSLAAEADAVEAIARATITLLRKAMMLSVERQGLCFVLPATYIR